MQNTLKLSTNLFNRLDVLHNSNIVLLHVINTNVTSRNDYISDFPYEHDL